MNLKLSQNLNRHRAFTLIELLVVISIIALLAAMLLPVIGMVRDAARATRCMSSIRQCHLAVIAYAGEQDGLLLPARAPASWYPGNNADLTTNTVAHWHEMLRPYFDQTGATTRRDVFWGCPLWRGRSGNAAWTGFGMNVWTQIPVSYAGALCNVATWNYNNTQDANYVPVSLGRVTFQSQRMLLGDANDWWLDVSWWQDSTGYYYYGDKERHRGRMNGVRFDGSARSYTPATVVASVNDPANAP